MEKLKSLLAERKHLYPELCLHKNFEKRLKWELIEVEVQDLEEYFLKMFYEGKKYPTNENNLLICKFLDIVDDVNLDEEPLTKNGEYPDVDVDYLPIVRDYLKNTWAPQKFGEDKVCNIGNYGTFGLKSTFIDMARVHGLDRSEILQITTNLRIKDDEGEALTYQKALELYPELNAYCEKYPDVAVAVQKLLHRNRNMGKHAGGLILCNQPIDKFVPLVKGSEGEAVSAWVEGLSGQDLGPVGLIKFDLLVVSSLWQIALTVKMVKQRHNLKNISALEGQWDWSDLSYLDDVKCMEMANAGDLKCVFQYDSEGIRKLARKCGMDCFDDLVNLVALYRPGPLNQGMDETYTLRKRGTQEYKLHPVIEPILGKTYGIMIFQEDVMKILAAVGKIPLRDCYVVIKAISKKKVEAFAKYQDKFIENGQIVLQTNEDEVKKLFEQIKSFSEYGFNKCITKYNKLYDHVKNTYFTVGELYEKFLYGSPNVVLDSYVDGKIVKDKILNVFETGEKEVFEFELDNGIVIQSTMDHKFYCVDRNFYTMKEIIENNLEILSVNLPNEFLVIKTCRVKSSKILGIQKTFNLTMESDQHNYAIFGLTEDKFIISRNSHSVAYSYISARQLYLKVHYPLEFYTATLQCESDDQKLRDYISEATNHGVEVCPLDINLSKETFSIFDGNIYIGFSNIKGIGEDKAKRIVELQPYDSFEDFLSRFGTEATVLRALVPLGVFKENNPVELYKFWLIFSDYQKVIKDRQKRFEVSLSKLAEVIKEALPEQLHVIKLATPKNIQILSDYIERKDFENKDQYISLLAGAKKKAEAALKRFADKAPIKPTLEVFISDEVKIDDAKVLPLLNNRRLAQETYYGYPWDNRVRNTSEYQPNKNFNNLKLQDEAGALWTTVMCEVLEVNIKKFKSGKGSFVSLTVMDDNFEIGRITIWDDDYQRFKPELKKGNLISIQVCPPSNGFSSYTFKSPPRHKRYELPKEKSMDYRLVLIEESNKDE